MSTEKKYPKVRSRKKGVEKPVRKDGNGVEQGPAGL
jgi:hypothetical protein